MKRVREWLLFGIQFVVKTGFLGKYKLVSTAVLEETKPNKAGLKTLEKTIISLGKKIDELDGNLMKAKDEIATLEKDILGLQEKLEYVTSKNINSEKRISDFLIENVSFQNEKVSFQEEIISLNSTLEQATTLSERLQEEMKKWRT